MTDDTPPLPDELDGGLAFAYGEDTAASPFPSVFERIGELTGSKAKVLLRDDQAGDTPMLKPLGPGDPRAAGKYVVHGELGRGGVGIVHRGHDQDLGRDVAMKFLHDKYKNEPDILHRFVEEAQIGGQLQHPGIVPVYDLGMLDGRPFFSMKLVKGQTLAKKLAERESTASDSRTFLSIFEDVCQTMAYAHARGVVHRDLKPSNIMIGSFGEVQVVDWGVGKVLQQGGVADEKLAAESQAAISVIETTRSSGHGSQSMIGSVMGTPAYMPPEQARGDVEAMDERSDVFALGGLLAEILTGKPPYPGQRDVALAMAARANQVELLERLDSCDGDGELVELAKLCLMPAPAVRPKSAAVVAQAVHDHLAAVEERVHEARVEAAEAKVRAASLKRTQTLGISLTGVIAAGLLVSLWFWRAADTAATNEEVAKLAAVASAEEAKENEQLAVEQTEVAERELARALEIKGLITEMLQSIRPEQAKGADITLLKGILDTASKRLTEGAIEDELVAAELHYLTGSVYESIGLYPEAELHLPAALELRKRVLGAEHPHTLESMAYLGILYVSQARYAEAEQLYLQVLEIGKRVMGGEHQSTLASMGNLASLYRSQVRYAEAEQLYLETLEIEKRVLGGEHPDTLKSMGNLALLYWNQGRYAEAEQLRLETLEIQKRVLGGEHPSTLLSMGNLGILYTHQARYAEAEQLFLQVLEIGKRVLGGEHPSTLAYMANLASLYAMQARYAEAEQLNLQLLEIMKRLLGGEHPDTLAQMANLATLYFQQNRYAEAEQLYLQVLEIQKRVQGEEHPETLNSMGNLSALYTRQGRYADAEPLLLQTLEMAKRVLGEEHAGTLRSMVNLADLYGIQGRYAEAEQLSLETLEIQKRVLGEEHPDTLESMANLAILYSRQGRYADAEQLSLETLEITKRVLGEEHAGTLRSMAILAVAYLDQGRYADAEPLLLQTLEMAKRVLSEEHPVTLASMENLALLYKSQGHYAEAEQLSLEAREIMKRVLGEEHPDTLKSMGNLAALYWDQGRDAEAEQLYLQVLEIQKRVRGEEHPDTLRMLTSLGLRYNSMERFEEAADMFEVSLPINRRVLGLQHPRTGNAMQGLVTAYMELGRIEDALALQRERVELLVAAANRPDANADVLNRVAWNLLTIEIESLRDPEEALGFAKRACALAEKEGLEGTWNMLDTLALAQHNTGDTNAAIETQKRAIALLPEGADPSKAESFAEKLAEYEAALSGD